MVDTIKDYAIKALVNTVDHLGAVSCKLNDMLGHEVDEFSQTELRVSCIQQVYMIYIVSIFSLRLCPD